MKSKHISARFPALLGRLLILAAIVLLSAGAYRPAAQAAVAESQKNPDLQRYALEQAVRANRGPLLPDYYDDWIVPERKHLHTVTLIAFQKLIAIQEQQRDYSTAIHIALSLMRLAPTSLNIVCFRYIV